MADDPRLNVIFVADGHRLELQSWLLASTLAVAHSGVEGLRIYSYAGADWLPQMRPVTHAVYEAAGVELRELPAPPRWANPYPHGNKIVAATDRRRGARALFLDTDMVCMKPLIEMADLPPDSVAAAPEGKPTWGTENDRWRRAYAHFGMELPTDRVKLLRGRKQAFYPYFNAGFVAFPETPHGGLDKPFADLWLETALEFDHNCKIARKRPWLDQITLPLTLARFGFRIRVLGETWNYSLSHRGDYSQTPDAHILHFHRSRFLQAAPQWPAVKEAVFETVPTPHHNAVRDGMRELELEV